MTSAADAPEKLDALVRAVDAAPVYDVAVRTPLDPMPRLSARLGNTVLLKREDLQPVFSFKVRGAYACIARRAKKGALPGVLAASAGNHAQGVALAAARLGIDATIVMPRTTPPIKVEGVRARGAKVVLHGDTFDEASEHAVALAAETGFVLVPPYDDLDVIAGQGTVGKELAEQDDGGLDVVFVPVGGGGLIAGIAGYLKRVRPNTRVIGVEPDETPTLHRALQEGAPVTLDRVGLFADGVAVRRIGTEPFRLVHGLVDEVVLVSVDETCAAIKDIFEDTRSIAEPAGALAIAGLKKYCQREGLRDARLAAIHSGANVNFDRLRHVAERAELGEQREAILAVTIPERPGSFLTFCETIGRRHVTEFNYRYAGSGDAQVFVGVQLGDGDSHAPLIDALRAKGYGVTDLSDDETAKVHVRYMVGGRQPALTDEVLYRFEFPERPGALLDFLRGMRHGWNISLFHYRNHGSAYGRVLCGIQVPGADRDAFETFLQDVGYPHWEETANAAYRAFLL